MTNHGLLRIAALEIRVQQLEMENEQLRRELKAKQELDKQGERDC